MKNKTFQQKLVPILLVTLLFLCFMLCSCQNNDSPYKTYLFNEGTIHFSFEYPSDYKIDWVKPAEDAGGRYQREAYISFKGSVDRHENDYTYFGIAAMLPYEMMPDAKSAVERVEKTAATWAEYKLYNKSEITIDGAPGYRIDYQIVDIVPAIAGDEPGIAVYRYVYFDAKGLVWTINIHGHSSFAEGDKIHFEHLLETFRLLK